MPKKAVGRPDGVPMDRFLLRLDQACQARRDAGVTASPSKLAAAMLVLFGLQDARRSLRTVEKNTESYFRRLRGKVLRSQSN
jgi:hypothetical protein